MRALVKWILPVTAYDALKRVAAQARADRFRPDYDPDRLVRVLLASKRTGGGVFDGIGNPRRAGRRSDALNRVLEHFASRPSPGFIFNPSPLLHDGGEAGDQAKHWITLASDQVREMTGAALRVYGKSAPALRPGFPWGGEWYGGNEDVLFPARPHRFGFAPRLALAVVGKRYPAAEFTALLSDWMRFATRHPTLPFISTFVVIQRLIASSCALFFLMSARDAKESAHSELCIALLRIIGQDIAFLIPRIGNSYPNGHLLTDRFAGWFMAAVYPEFCGGRIVTEQAESLWLAELERQTYEDGGSFEHAVHYHGLAAELAVSYLLLKRGSAEAVSPRHLERIENMLRIQADLSGPDGNAPRIGDAAEDPMLPLDGGTGTTAAALREVYRGLFAPSIPPLFPHHGANERAFWLLSSHRQSSRDSRSRRLSANRESGLFVFFDDDEATRLVFRTGASAETATLSGHMHSDLLSVCAVHKGAPMLVDSGTYSYRWRTGSTESEVPEWRAYLSGPLAHNGVVVGERDPLGAVTGDFRSGPAPATVVHTKIIEGERLSLVEARIALPPEYATLTRGVVHVRDEYFLVYTLIGADVAAEAVTLPLQLHPRAQLAGELDRVVDIAGENGARLSLVYSDELALSARHVGSTAPPGGWFSPMYGELVPATQLLFRLSANAVVSAFALCLNHGAPPLRIASCDAGGSNLVFRVTGTDFSDLVFVNSNPQAAPVSQCGVSFAGRLLWLRGAGNGRSSIRALDIVSCKAPAHGMDLAFAGGETEIADVRQLRQ